MKNQFRLKSSKFSIAKARKLRKKMTDSERKLWRLLRDSLLGVHFRRQAPLGPYIVDFLCLKPRIVVELDGSQHYQKDASIYDSERDAYFQQEGFTVLRFNDREFLTNSPAVLQKILDQIQTQK